MTSKETFKPLHLNATPEDLAGNNGIGRYIFLPGSDGRAKDISQHFDNLTVKNHPRGHHLYLGTITDKGNIIDVAATSSGMGCPSMEIILHELFHLGGKRFLRVGTSGTLQPALVKLQDIVIAQATVRDEDTTRGYVPIEIPAIASFEFIAAIADAAKQLGIHDNAHIGTVHCKSSFYARQYGAGPSAEVNNAYLNLMEKCGVLCSEMETSTLFIQSQLYNHQLMLKGHGPQHRVLCAAILGIIAVPPNFIDHAGNESKAVKNSVKLALEAVKLLAESERA